MKARRSLSLILVFLALALFFSACNQVNAPSENPGSISGRVFFDKNADEGCNDCECGLEQVKIRLYEESCQGLFLQTVYSDSDGYFHFLDLTPMTYCVLSDLPPTCDGYLATTSTSQIVTMSPGEEVELSWFGYDNYVDVND